MHLKDRAQDLAAEHDLTTLEFWNGFLHAHIVPFRHREYIRVASITLALPENRDRGLLEVATDFANSIHGYKQRNSQFQLLPEHRTTTVFWLYQVKLALDSLWKAQGYVNSTEAPPFPVILSRAPDLLNEKLPNKYYSDSLLNSGEAQKYWMLPDIKALPDNADVPKPLSFAAFGNKTKHDADDYHLVRYIRLALVVVQHYLRPGETRRRSWFIQLAFDSTQREIIKLRASGKPEIPLYSETQAYFYLQLVHAALSQLQTTGKEDMIETLTYHSFQQLFAIKPSIWKKHYSPKVWDQLESRGRFNPPDLKPLPNTISPANVIESNSIKQASLLQDSNEPFRKLGLIPELPAFEIINFNLNIFLEDYKTATLPISPSSPNGIPTHAHLLRYIYIFVIRGGSTDNAHARAKQALSLLSRNPSLNPTRTTFLLNLALSLAPGISLAYPSVPSLQPNPDYNPPPPPEPNFGPNRIQVQNGRRSVRYHNCPCHAQVPMAENAGGKEAVEYPDTYPYREKTQLYHGCACHPCVPLDQDKLAAVMAEKYKKIEKMEKTRNGTCFGGGDTQGWKEDDGFGKWVRSNLVLVCPEEVGRVWYPQGKIWGGEEGKEKWVRPDKKVGNEEFLVLIEPEEGDDGIRGLVEGTENLGLEGEDDAKTLAGKEEEQGQGDEDEDWEAVSQTGTLV
ncbi:hypothetical protein QBC44DRAFT_345448 [Cladorrhinum sp. PSN332]|nr:hypothetical protein QBC44DRAFT_345448 [Cladorrhinum sp. PSN332]